MKRWIASWKRSVQPRKQRKYRYNAIKQVKGKFLSGHLNKSLQEKYKRRSLRLRKGDKVKIMRGHYKGQEGKIEHINLRESFVYVTKIEVSKKDGSKVRAPIHASNILILDIDTSDKYRMEKLNTNAKANAKIKTE
ncbi:MAG: 50S ribosomal protein L24 [Nanoarchaeota archaeon]